MPLLKTISIIYLKNDQIIITAKHPTFKNTKSALSILRSRYVNVITWIQYQSFKDLSNLLINDLDVNNIDFARIVKHLKNHKDVIISETNITFE
jgi:hypothetical protein